MVLRTTGPYDLYREQVTATPSVYDTNPTSDDFRQNGVVPFTPTEPQRNLTDPYSPTQQTVDSWNTQLRQLHKQQ